MRILITGASGFIGRYLTDYLAQQGYDVLALSRRGINVQGARHTYTWQLGQFIPLSAATDIAYAIHLAHDFNGQDGAHNTQNGTLKIIEQLRAAKTPRQVFFSSYSASNDATSVYGQCKMHIEHQLANASDITIVRPGLVLGDGGLYGKIKKWAQVLPLIPLPDGGTGKVPVVDIDQLCTQTLHILQSQTPKTELNAFNPKLTTLKDLTLEAAAKAGRKPYILPIPSTLLLFLLNLGKKLHLPLPVNADNLKGFLSNQNTSHKPTSQG